MTHRTSLRPQPSFSSYRPLVLSFPNALPVLSLTTNISVYIITTLFSMPDITGSWPFFLSHSHFHLSSSCSSHSYTNEELLFFLVVIIVSIFDSYNLRSTTEHDPETLHCPSSRLSQQRNTKNRLPCHRSLFSKHSSQHLNWFSRFSTSGSGSTNAGAGGIPGLDIYLISLSIGRLVRAGLTTSRSRSWMNGRPGAETGSIRSEVRS